ncbi:MAG: bifunctional UDP-N-acetylglucosamine diphosphorylase/glucosamine-1-phosphate N-acetyltransferase GlmU [Ruminococcus sp.]|jgi:bifunctional UDP-N-acetylglucosamine pyrophosphorylase/glucosamine-1-phosphate N-acetyltransferase|nr:bifunctional UDP-N-acetylglucosamine diphosphorylase/glucosamine-1-phosphate N-acetyltransferase GlmU [Ruminococcus sp.]
MSACALILAGGKGTRMKSELPKPMFEVLGEPMLEWVLSACENSEISDICVVKGYNAAAIDEFLSTRGKKCDTVLQKERLGTGHAVMTAREWLSERLDDDVLILCGDAPFIDEKTITESKALHKKNGCAVTVITAKVEAPTGYGRIVMSKGKILGIVEEKDLTDAQKGITEINSGAMWFSIKALLYALDEIKPNNSQNEYYLTDSIHILSSAGYKTGTYISDNERVVLGANDRKGLLKLNDIARREIIGRHLDEGVEFTCTDGVQIGRKVKIAPGVKILQGTILSGETSIGKNTVIGVNCLIDNCTVGENCNLNSVQSYNSQIGDNVTMGPFVRIRPGSVIKSGVKIGNFVEVKNSTVGEKTAIAHLTYVGDSDVGKNVNFGCGVVTVNYDGVNKNRTVIGDEAFIGCNTNLVAPVKVGKRGYTAAGSTVTKDVPDGALAIERTELYIKEGFSDRKLKK